MARPPATGGAAAGGRRGGAATAAAGGERRCAEDMETGAMSCACGIPVAEGCDHGPARSIRVTATCSRLPVACSVSRKLTA